MALRRLAIALWIGAAPAIVWLAGRNRLPGKGGRWGERVVRVSARAGPVDLREPANAASRSERQPVCCVTIYSYGFPRFSTSLGNGYWEERVAGYLVEFGG